MKEISYDNSRVGEMAGMKVSELGTVKRAPPLMRTFRGDVVDRIEDTPAVRTPHSYTPESASSDEDHHFGKIIFILLTVLAFGIGLGMYVLIGAKSEVPTSADPVVIPLTESRAEVQIDNSPREQVMADIYIAYEKSSLALGTTREITFLGKNLDGDIRPATTAELLVKISQSSPPASLLRSLSAVPFYGFYADDTRLIGYYLLQSRSYPNTFAAILDWEANMARDLVSSLDPMYGRKNIANMKGRPFIDERIAGVDARVLRDVEGSPLVAYAFVNKKTLIIAGSDTALLDLIEKIASDQVLVLP